MTSPEGGIRVALWGPSTSLGLFPRPLVKPDFIELKERLTEGEEYVKELEELLT